MPPFLVSEGGLLGAIVAAALMGLGSGILAYFGTRRQYSGTVATATAKDILDEGRAIRERQDKEIDRLARRYDDLEARSTREMGEMRKAESELRQQFMRIVSAEAECKAALAELEVRLIKVEGR